MTVTRKRRKRLPVQSCLDRTGSADICHGRQGADVKWLMSTAWMVSAKRSPSNTEPPASVIAAPARGSRNLLRPELSSPPRPRGRGRALQATSWTRHPTAKDSEATCGKVWPRKRPREPREDRHPKGRDLRAERTMPPRRSAGSERDGGRRTWGAGTGGAQSSGSGPVQPAHE